MKLRIHDDSLRLRLTPAEVARLAVGGAVTSETAFAPGMALVVRVESSDRPALSATFEGGAVTVRLPQAQVGPWAGSGGEAIAGEQDAGAGRTLRVSVERDYACLHRDGESAGGGAAGTFPHPARARADRA